MKGESLDAAALEQLAAEGALHTEALRALRAGDRRAFEAETSRHLRRVDKILAEHSRRRDERGAAG
jgi:hypothetical protein